MPAARPSDSLFGHTAADATILPAGVPIDAITGDSHAAMFGHGITAPGACKATIGTGFSVGSITVGPPASSHGLSGTIAWARGDRLVHALEGNISVSGQAITYAARLLGLGDENAMSAIAQSVPDSGGVAFVPALAGLGAPHWKDRVRGLIQGLSLGTRPAHVARAAFDAMQITDVVAAVEVGLGQPFGSVHVDGGATRNDLLLQLLSDTPAKPLERRPQMEASALGAARMAADAIG